MKKNIWIWNHHATNMFKDRAGRHYWFAENLIKQGYNPSIFCASTNHFSNENIDTKGDRYIVESINDVPFVCVNTPDYVGNGKKRILNMVSFYRNLFPVAKDYAKKNGNPDVIVASSVHPLTLVAGIKVARKFGIPCICEVRDLWPETLVAYNSLTRNSTIARLLYSGERWVYSRANMLIFTMEGGKDYIIEKRWDSEHGGPINLQKVHHINNGVDLEAFDYNKEHYILEDDDMDDDTLFKVVYTGSIRQVNKIDKVLDAAKIIGDQNIKFLIWGSGDQLESLKKRVLHEQINNVCFKGRVDKKYVPYITNKAQLNIILGDNNLLYRYGGSMNKLFEYFASGKPVLSSFKMEFSLIDRFKTGIELEDSSPQNIAESIMYFKNLVKEDYEGYCKAAKQASENYNFCKLTNLLIRIIEDC